MSWRAYLGFVAVLACGSLAAPASASAIAPSVEHAVIGNPTDTTVGLNAYVNPHEDTITQCRFEWGLDTSYGHTAPCAPGPAGGGEFVVTSADLTGLTPQTTYHFRLFAVNSAGTTVGSDQSFTTFPAPVDPASCPNAQIRTDQGSTRLGQCRGFELVSPAQKNGGFIKGGAPDAGGERISYEIFNDLSGGGLVSQMIGHRTPSGWQSHSIYPQPAQRIESGNSGLFVENEALTQFMSAQFGLGGFPPTRETIARLDGDGGQTILHTFPASQNISGLQMTVSEDGSRAYADVAEQIDPNHIAGTSNVYDFGQNPPVLVSRMPDGTVPACGVEKDFGFLTAARGSGSGEYATTANHWTSADGSKVFFLSRGDNCSEPEELYRRDVDTGSTELVSGPALGGADGEAHFVQANADGSAVVYTSQAQLSPADTNTGPDIYLWRQGAGNTCLTCVFPASSEDVWAGFAAPSEDLSHVYFLSHESLPSGVGVPEEIKLYVSHHGQVDYVAPLGIVGNEPYHALAQVTPDGNAAVFQAFFPGYDALSHSLNGGNREFYRYDDLDKSLTCISCPGSGPAAKEPFELLSGEGLPNLTPNARAISDNGQTIVFTTDESLVSSDVNGTRDSYEWHDGRVSLLSDGVSSRSVNCCNVERLNGMSASGNDIFLTSWAKMTADAGDGSSQIYDARVGGGFAQATNIPCSGEACQPSSSMPPSFGPFGSATVAGSGNLAPPETGPVSGSPPKSKPLTRTQLLAKALRVCHKKPKRQRHSCEKAAHKKYGKPKAKSKSRH